MKIRRYIPLIILILLAVFSLLKLDTVYANEHTLEKLHIHVLLKSDGSAIITENRKANLIEGSENFIVIENLGKSKIKDFIVWENGKTFQYIDEWNVKASREEKAFKNGIIETKDGYELSWGIGEYGEHHYIIEYTVTNFIKELQDSQILFWRFVNDQLNIPPEEVTVEIESEHALSSDTENIWAFGYTGHINFHEDKVIATSSEPLNEEDYVTVLIQFPNGMFTTSDKVDQTFVAVKEQAFNGSDYGKVSTNKFPKGMTYFRSLFIILILFSYFYGKYKNQAPKLTKKKPKKFKRKFNEEYFHDFPYQGNMLDIYYLLYIMGASNFNKLFTSLLLKWMKEERIMIDSSRSGIDIYFFNREMKHGTFESEIFHMMLDTTGSDDILKVKTFKKSVSINRDKLIHWEQRIINQSLHKLQDAGYLILQEKRGLFFKTEDYVLTREGDILEENIYKYINYLHDYSLLNEHEANNVMIWDQIMIGAALLGLTDVVRKQFKKLYPKYDQETIYSTSSLEHSHSFSNNVSSARTPTFDSSGGGGSSSSGGGGGSYGGGSGGGTR